MNVSSAELFVLADNRTRSDQLVSTWGLSILANVEGRTILFDVDSRWSIVEYNAKVIDAPLDRVEYIVISHWHGDHAGGLADAIRYYENLGKKVTVIIPSKRRFLLDSNTNIIVGKKPVKLLDGAMTTGVLGFTIKEQALIINIKDKGPLVLVGCSHPGINTILSRVCQLLNTNSVYGLIGGYHISGFEAFETLKILKEYNVKVIGPAHCTSDDAIEVFKYKFEGRFIEVYTGLRVAF